MTLQYGRSAIFVFTMCSCDHGDTPSGADGASTRAEPTRLGQPHLASAATSLPRLMASDSTEMTLRDYGNVIVRRKWVVILAVLLSTVIAIALTALQTPIYSASAQVLVQPRGQDGLFESQNDYLDERAIDTEIQVIEGEAGPDPRAGEPRPERVAPVR